MHDVPAWPEIVASNFLYGLAVLRAIHQYFNSQCDIIIIAKSQLSCVARPAAKHVSLSSASSSPLKAVYNDITSPKGFVHWKVGEELAWLDWEEGDPNNGYVVAVKTNVTKTVEIKCNNNLPRFQLQFINFILTEPKLAHGPVKLPVRSSKHFVMNINMA